MAQLQIQYIGLYSYGLVLFSLLILASIFTSFLEFISQFETPTFGAKLFQCMDDLATSRYINNNNHIHNDDKNQCSRLSTVCPCKFINKKYTHAQYKNITEEYLSSYRQRVKQEVRIFHVYHIPQASGVTMNRALIWKIPNPQLHPTPPLPPH